MAINWFGQTLYNSKRPMSKLSYFLLLAAAALPLTVSAQLTDDYNPPRTNCCLAGTAQTLANQLQDWNALGRYHADD